MNLLSRLRSRSPEFASAPNVLLVENQDVDAQKICDTLQRAGATMSRVPTAHAAREILRRIRFDIIMVDLTLPDVSDALDFVTELRGTGPVIVLVEHDAVGISAMLRGAAEYVVKGVTRALELVAVVSRVLRDCLVHQSSPPCVIAERTRAKTAQILARVNVAADAATRTLPARS